MDSAHINRTDRAEFVRLFGHVFENSPWVAEEAWDQRPFADLEAVHDAMVRVVKDAPRERQLQLLRAHPELAGREAQDGTMTAASKTEQTSVGLNVLSQAEMAEIARLNAEYRRAHGFPFIIAVRQHSKAEIFAEFERRLSNDTETERGNALMQIFTITRLRVQALENA